MTRPFRTAIPRGAISGEPGTCIAVSCTAGAIKTCLGDDALTCNATGDGYEHVACDLGCKNEPTPHCGYIEPRYLPDICDSPAATDLTISTSGSLDPNLDLNCNGGLLSQPGAPSICIVHYRNINVAANATFQVVGVAETNVGRAIAFVADDDLHVEGILDVSASGIVNGPGGGVTISGRASQVTSSTVHVAAGGAGGQTAGGAGGSSSADGGAANGGLQLADPALLAAFVGGAAAARPTSGMNGGGGGGGAAMLVACRGSLSVTGSINAGGGGGSAGFLVPIVNSGLPGFGGGAGGYVVLQASRISVTGQVFANGGGGGAGMRADQTPGVGGKDGLMDTAVATGGYPQNNEGRGGNGGAATTPPTVGGKPTMLPPATAGGGSVGFLQTYTPDGIEPTLTPTAVSPAFQPNATIKTR
jgi:hypothetical protein